MADIELVIKIPEDIRVTIGKMGLLRIPNEMIRVVDKAIQHGIPFDNVLDKIRTEIKYKQEIQLKGENESEWNKCISEMLEIIDKYRESDEVTK